MQPIGKQFKTKIPKLLFKETPLMQQTKKLPQNIKHDFGLRQINSEKKFAKERIHT